MNTEALASGSPFLETKKLGNIGWRQDLISRGDVGNQMISWNGSTVSRHTDYILSSFPAYVEGTKYWVRIRCLQIQLNKVSNAFRPLGNSWWWGGNWSQTRFYYILGKYLPAYCTVDDRFNESVILALVRSIELFILCHLFLKSMTFVNSRIDDLVNWRKDVSTLTDIVVSTNCSVFGAACSNLTPGCLSNSKRPDWGHLGMSIELTIAASTWSYSLPVEGKLILGGMTSR